MFLTYTMRFFAMANTHIDVNDPKTNQLWSKVLMTEAKKKSYFYDKGMVGPEGILTEQKELSKGPGDRITVQLATIPTGHGRTSTETLEGNEESQTTYTDTLYIDELAHAMTVPTNRTIDATRVGYSPREAAVRLMGDWAAITIDSWVFNQLAGNSATSIEFDRRAAYTSGDLIKATGMNTAIAPSSTRLKIAGGKANDQSLTSSDTLTLDLIDAMLEEATLATDGAGSVQPIIVNGEERYPTFIPYEGYVDLKRDGTSTINWFDLQKAVIQGGAGTNADIFKGAIGTYDKAIFYTTSRLPSGVHSSTGATVASTKRVIMCGKGAGSIAFGGNKDRSGSIDYEEELFDYKRKLGVSVSIIGGVKKTQFNNIDAGVITGTCWAARHNS